MAAPATACPTSDSTRRASVSRTSTAVSTWGLIRSNSPPRSGVKAGGRARSAVHHTTSRRLPAPPATSSVSLGRAPRQTSSTVTWGWGGAAGFGEAIFVRRGLHRRDEQYYPTARRTSLGRRAQTLHFPPLRAGEGRVGVKPFGPGGERGG